MLTAPQCRAARGLLDWSQAQLAEMSSVGLSTVRNFEAGRSLPMANNLSAIVRAFQEAGVKLIARDGSVGVEIGQEDGDASPR